MFLRRRASFRFTWQGHCSAPFGVVCLAAFLASLIQFAVARVDLGLAAGEHIGRRDESDGAVQTHGVVPDDVLLDHAPRIVGPSMKCPGDHSLFSDLCQRSNFPFD